MKRKSAFAPSPTTPPPNPDVRLVALELNAEFWRPAPAGEIEPPPLDTAVPLPLPPAKINSPTPKPVPTPANPGLNGIADVGKDNVDVGSVADVNVDVGSVADVDVGKEDVGNAVPEKRSEKSGSCNMRFPRRLGLDSSFSGEFQRVATKAATTMTETRILAGVESLLMVISDGWMVLE